MTTVQRPCLDDGPTRSEAVSRFPLVARLIDEIAQLHPPIRALDAQAAKRPARPMRRENRETSIFIIAIGDRIGDEQSRHRGGVEAVSAESARIELPVGRSAYERHLVQRIAHDARPGIVDRW